MNLTKTGVWYFTDGMSAAEAAETALRIESLGYSALWIPEATGLTPIRSRVLAACEHQRTDRRDRDCLDLPPGAGRHAGSAEDARRTVRQPIPARARRLPQANGGGCAGAQLQ